MILTHGDISGVILTEHTMHHDQRGYFCEVFRHDTIDMHIIGDFVQENESFSQKGVWRGLHFNRVKPQAKLTRVAFGRARVILFDLRPESPTYQALMTYILTPGHTVYIPRGIAHGFLALEDTVYVYKCDAYYHPDGESGISYTEPSIQTILVGDMKVFGITDLIISDRDNQLPSLQQYLQTIE